MNASDTGHVDGPPFLLLVGVGEVGQLHRPRVEGISLRENKPALLPCLQERKEKVSTRSTAGVIPCQVCRTMPIATQVTLCSMNNNMEVGKGRDARSQHNFLCLANAYCQAIGHHSKGFN